MLLQKITFISLSQIICEVRVVVLIIRMQNQGVQEERIVEENSDLTTGISSITVSQQTNKIHNLKERKLFSDL